MDKARHLELTARLNALVDLLADESGLCPPPEAASLWSEAAIRRWFETGGAVAPAVPDKTQPGGGLPQPVCAATAPPAMVKAQDNLTVDAYRAAAFGRGIPVRAHGLFPPDCPVLQKIMTSGMAPFEKHLIDGTGALAPVLVSWPVGDDAAASGIDLRYFAKRDGGAQNGGTGAMLLAAVRYGDRAGIGGPGFFTGAHGGAIESAFDEATAELCKITMAPLATTIDFSCKIKKPVRLNTSIRA
jgi:hypothetical protein